MQYNEEYSRDWELGMCNADVLTLLLESRDMDDLVRAKGMRHYLSTLSGQPSTVPASDSDVSQCL